jgi:hypothetical protein
LPTVVAVNITLVPRGIALPDLAISVDLDTRIVARDGAVPTHGNGIAATGTK